MMIRKRFLGAVLVSVLATLALLAAACDSASSPTATGSNIDDTADTVGSLAAAPVTPTPTAETVAATQEAPTATATAAPGVPTATPAPGLPATQVVPATAMELPEIADMVESVRDSVVSIVAEVVSRDIFGREQGNFASGSGVIVDDQGHIITNNHVIEGARSVVVTLDDGRQLDAQIVGTDPLTDMAVLLVNEAGLPHLNFANPDALRVGNWVVAIGNALALPGGPTVTLGIVSALDRSFQVDQNVTLHGLVQTDAVINPGNSGGPLINLAGEIVGINTAVVRGDRVEGIGFAVGGETAVLVSRQLIESGGIQWPWLGVFISELDAQQAAERDLPVQHGVLVADVFPDSPAWGGGIRAGDVMLSISGHELPTVRELTRVLRFEFQVGDLVKVEVWRDGERRTFEFTLGERPAS